jgi:hypothetical protein
MIKDERLPEGTIISLFHKREEDRLVATVADIRTRAEVQGKEVWVTLARGIARVSRKEKSPSKKMGRHIAIERAFKALEVGG